MPVTSKKRTLLIAGAAVGIIALIAVGYIVWTIFLAPPSKQDFADAKNKAEKITEYSGTTLLREFYVKVGAEARKGVSQQKLVQASNPEKQKTINALKSRAKLAKEIEGSRVLHDAETKKVFASYSAREDRYSKYIQDYLEALPMYESSFLTCADVFQITKMTTDEKQLAKVHKAASIDCVQDLTTLAKSPIPPFANYAKEFKRIIVERQKVLDGIQDGTLSTEKASAKVKELSADFSRNNPTNDIKKYGEEAVFNGELNNLIKVLTEKS